MCRNLFKPKIMYCLECSRDVTSIVRFEVGRFIGKPQGVTDIEYLEKRNCPECGSRKLGFKGISAIKKYKK